MQLNDGQLGAVDTLSGSSPVTDLTGFPGVGKTTVLIEWLKLQPSTIRVLLTAPTNKAVGVMKEMCAVQKITAECMTTQSALGLTMRWIGGKQKLVPNTRLQGMPPYYHYDVVNVDEMSMIDDDITGKLDDARAEAGNRLVLSGDRYQLPPVEAEVGEISPSFQLADSHAALTKIERQRAGPITELGALLRSELDKPLKRMRTIDVRDLMDLADNDQMTVLPRSEVWPMMLDDFAGHEAEDLRYIAFENRVVDKGVRAIRDVLYGTDSEEYVEGEKIQCLKPVINREDQAVVFCTDQLLTIDSLSETEMYDLPVWQITANGYTFWVVKGTHKDAYKLLEAQYLRECKAKQRRWPEFYELVEGLSHVRSAQGLTVHKSQGGTFLRVYANAANIIKVGQRDPALANRLMNVASSRPSSQLILAV